MKILIVNIGFLGDSLFAASLGENCKKNGYERVDLVIGFPQTLELLKLNPHIDNIYLSTQIGAYPSAETLPSEIDLSIYDIVYPTDHSVFSEKFLDTYNKKLNLPTLEYNLNLYLPKVEFEESDKKSIAFQTDWDKRSYQGDNKPRNPKHIINSISDKYNVFVVGENTHFNIHENTSSDFLDECKYISACDYFFGFPGGMHWLAAGGGTKTITTSEHMMDHFTATGDFKGSGIEDFRNDFMLHASKHFDNEHVMLEPGISDDKIISYLLDL
jgi:hypothetical protein